MGRHHVTRELVRGLVSGLAGTAVMTAVQKVDMKLTGREGSTAPAKAVEKVFHIEPKSEAAEARLATITHWVYGTGWGLARSAIAQIAPPVPATAAHFAAVWGAGLLNLTVLGLAPPPTQWAKETIAKDVMYHAAYAAGAGVTYELLARAER